MKFYGNDEGNDESCDSYASDDDRESDFDFDYDELVDNFDEFELSDEDIEVYVEELNLMNENCITDGGSTSISFKELAPLFKGTKRSICNFYIQYQNLLPLTFDEQTDKKRYASTGNRTHDQDWFT